jgi:hypothetical protein
MMLSQGPNLSKAPREQGSIVMRRSLVTFAVLACVATPTHADAIDGDWCNTKDERLTIIGPQITLPTGKSLTGKYHRHEFAYQVPAGEADAGNVIYMQLYGDDDMTSFIVKDKQTTVPTNWKRCPVLPKTS